MNVRLHNTRCYGIAPSVVKPHIHYYSYCMETVIAGGITLSVVMAGGFVYLLRLPDSCTYVHIMCIGLN